MNFICMLGSHKWQGCKCTACGEVRDQQHDWSGPVRNWERGNWQWLNKCKWCGKVRDVDYATSTRLEAEVQRQEAQQEAQELSKRLQESLKSSAPYSRGASDSAMLPTSRLPEIRKPGW